ncbi:MAG: hypothetical protein ACRC2T_07160 [Thermoguttaceae bacterium]
MSRTIFTKLSLIILLLFVTGCGNTKLKGKVVYSDDGSPLPAGIVCFKTDTFLARGQIGEDGTFTVGSKSENDGLPSGTYEVYITNATKPSGSDSSGMPILEELIVPGVLNGEKSPIKMDISSSTKEIELKVERL